MREALSYYLPSVFPPPPGENTKEEQFAPMPSVRGGCPPDALVCFFPSREIFRSGYSTASSSSLSLQRLLSFRGPKWRLIIENLILGCLILGWYAFSALANNVNKDILNIFPYAMSLTVTQFGFNALFSYILVRGFGFTEWQTISFDRVLRKVLPLSLGHILSNWTTYVALNHVALSFLHTVKASSPIFTAILAYLYLQETIDTPIMVSMAFIVCGVGLSSSGELSFNVFGFLMALLSTCIFCCQNVYSKRLFRDKELSYVMLLFYTSMASFVVMLPWWALSEAPNITYNASLTHLLSLYLLSAFCHWLQNVLAFAVLAAVSPLTYAIANTVKRIVVIVASILYFHNQVSLLNGSGITLVLAGVALYNKHKYDKAATKRPAEASTLGNMSKQVLPIHREATKESKEQA